MKIKMAFRFSILISLIMLTACKAETSEERKEVNILLIVADDLGFTDLGCFGSEIKTPNLDALASLGIINTAFYTAPTCSPTRAMLLTGVDNHRNGYGTMGSLAENQKGLRGYEGYLNFDIVTFPELLQERGYHTSVAGKWHLGYPVSDSSFWPYRRGFDRSFCLLQGGAGHFADKQLLFSNYQKTIYVENERIVRYLPANFYSSDYYSSKAIEFINESQKLNKPFFSYLGFTAPHWPLQAPDHYIDLYRGFYEEGYEVLAEKRLEKTRQLGIVSEYARLPSLSPNVPPWNSLTEQQQRESARIMEVYAAMVECLDANIGKVISHLKAIGEYDNTLIVFMSDNGAEGNNISTVRDAGEWIAENFDNSLENIGRKDSYVYTGPGWAQASTVPFKWYKAFATEGGVRSPAIITYPRWKHNSGIINDDYISVMDLAPTFLELTASEHPGTEYKGREIYSMDGISLVNWLKGNEEAAHSPEEAHCWELYGRRGVLKGVWKAEWLESPYGNDSWELFNLERDPGEQTDLALKNPDKLKELVAEWEKYASDYGIVLPNEKVSYASEDFWLEQ